MTLTTEHLYLIAFLRTDGLGRGTLASLYTSFDSWEALGTASDSTLANAGAKPKIIPLIRQAVRELPSLDETQELYDKYNITVILIGDDAYPPLLAQIPDAPIVLFVRGNVAALATTPIVTIVGTRAVTPYGQQVARTLAQDLARAGVAVVSGLALGVDAIAHRGALDGGGTTIGVLGSSIEDAQISPRTNYQLAREICTTGGCIISEYPIPTRAQVFTFPARNRIMAGMAHATLIIESSEKSGTLITARDALEYNRDVFAVPGSIFSEQSRGSNQLIARGAKIVTCVADILDELPALVRNIATETSTTQKPTKFAQTNKLKEFKTSKKHATPVTPPNLTETQTKIYNQLAGEPVHIDQIITRTGLPITDITTAIAMMEIHGHIRNIGAQHYIRSL